MSDEFGKENIPSLYTLITHQFKDFKDDIGRDFLKLSASISELATNTVDNSVQLARLQERYTVYAENLTEHIAKNNIQHNEFYDRVRMVETSLEKEISKSDEKHISLMATISSLNKAIDKNVTNDSKTDDKISDLTKRNYKTQGVMTVITAIVLALVSYAMK